MSYKNAKQFDRVDVSEGIDINKTSEWKESMLCHYWYFKDWTIVYITRKFNFNFCKKKKYFFDSILNNSLHN